MPMRNLGRKIISKIRSEFFPTEQDKILARWFADNGDYRHRCFYNLDQNSLVLDLGGYKGQWASDIFSRYLCRVMIFEPVSAFAQSIRERFEKNPKIQLFQFGLGANTRKDTIGVSADSSSLFGQHQGKEEAIDIVDIADFFKDNKVSFVNLMKINIEGGEYEVLERLIDTGLINSVGNIQVQFHNINKDSESRMHHIQNLLSRSHAITFQYNFVWENWSLKKAPDPM